MRCTKLICLADAERVYQLLQLGLYHDVIHCRLRTRVANDGRTKHRGQVVNRHLTRSVLRHSEHHTLFIITMICAILVSIQTDRS